MAGFRSLFRLIGREPAAAEDVAAEFEAHLQLKADALARTGLSPEAARAEAERRFGPLERFAAECRSIDNAERRERRWREWWSGTLQDLRLAARALRRAPGFAITAVVVLAVGIGLNATVFAVLRGVVLRPLPYPEADRLVAVYSSNPKMGWQVFSVSPADFYDWTRESRGFSAMVAWNQFTVAATGIGPAVQVPIAAVTSGFLGVTGVAPLFGRPFRTAEFDPGAPKVVILSHSTWASRFGGDPGLLGRRWILDGESYEIIGVMPRGFTFPVERIEGWFPFETPTNVASQRGAHYLNVVGRLAPGTTLEHAGSELATIAGRIAKDYPRSSAGWTALIRPMHEDVVGDVKPTLVLLMTGVGLLLVLACANVANLVLVRAIGRTSEVALRSALGAGSGRLLWLGASEVLVLVAAGAAGAIPVALLGAGVIRRFAPAGVPRIAEVTVDTPALLFTLGITALVALFVSLAPARRIANIDLRRGLGAAGGCSVGTRRGVHRWLVALEAALALALLAVAGVLVKSMARLQSVNPGFDARSTLVADLSLPDKRYHTGEAIGQFQEQLLGQLHQVPGVESAALIFGLPLTSFGFSSSFTIDSLPEPSDDTQHTQLRVVSPDYFATQHIPVLKGRGLTAEDRRGGRRVVVVSAAAARRFWPDGKALGHFLRLGASPGPDHPQGEIVGVVGDVRDRGLGVEPRPIVYASAAQVAVGGATILLRTMVPPLSVAPEFRRVLSGLDPDIPVSGLGTMEGVVRTATAPERFRTWLMGFFALLAAALAGLGVYGVISHIVAQRTREIGLRRALGAPDGRVVTEVVGAGMRDAAFGAAAGLLLGFGITRRLTGLLYQVSPGDPVVLALTTAGFLGLTLLACWVPARRAIRGDPVAVLRGE